MTGAQAAVAAGALISLGLVLVVWRFVPAYPDLRSVTQRLGPVGLLRPVGELAPVGTDARERVGVWAMRHVPPGLWGGVPTKDLAILRMTVARFYGEKVTFALVGLALPGLVWGIFALIGLTLPVFVPVVGTLGLAVMLWFIPNLNARTDAKKARLEFNRALGAYVDLIALERNAGSGPRQAMEVAAEVGESWVFRRVAEELARSRWSGQPPWDALRQLADELDLQDLSDLADIMRLSGEEGTQVYATLRARTAAMRTALLTAQQAKANETSERMVMPGSLLGVVFLALLIIPSVLRILLP